jgi:dynein heavy chain
MIHGMLLTQHEKSVVCRIFLSLVDFWMRRARYSPGITKLRTAMVTATIEIYQTVQRELLPTPEKSHYTYNLRDLGKVNKHNVQVFDI